MCGIAGIRRFDGVAVEEALLRRMASQLVHRGPDGDGVWHRPDVGFAHRRLAIIDPSGSPQPMADASGRLQVCFNGEIFNYRTLRRELVGLGHSFRTEGDTETLLEGFLAWGERSVDRLDGQFAYALFDERNAALWLFRDRLGILPLYYYWDGRVFLFASEVKALLPALPSPPELDVESVREYLAQRAVAPPHTLFRGISKLPQGHRLRLDASGHLDVAPYWQLPTERADAGITPADAVERVAHALEAAVESRLVADVPVGAYLSGGIDSSLIVALMTRLQGEGNVQTFSAGFGDPRFDELPFARQVSQRFRTRHHEVMVGPDDFEALWEKLTWHRDAPISEPADIAVYKLASTARPHVKVLLSGEGSDELFAGYPKYRFARWAQAAGWLPAALRRPLLQRLEAGLPARLWRARTVLRAMEARDEAERFRAWFAPFVEEEREALLPGVMERDGQETVWSRARGDLVQRMLYVDCHTWLADNLLERGDRMSMAASVESRPPFLDHHLVELAFRLPSSVKLRGGRGKWVVKEVARRLLPPEIVDRRKVGFRVPLDAWFRGELRELARDHLLGPGSLVAGLMDPGAVRGLLDGHESGRRNEEIRIWTLLCLEVWHRAFLKNGAGGAAGRER